MYLEDKKLIKRNIYSRQLKKPVLIDLLLNGNVIANSSVVVRKKILLKVGLINESKKLIASEDYNTWLKISSVTEKFLYLSKRLGYYYQTDKSISSKDMSQSYKFATHQFLPLLNKEQKIKLETNIRYSSGRFNYLNNFYKKAKKDLLFVLKFGSINLKFKSMIMIILMIKIFK